MSVGDSASGTGYVGLTAGQRREAPVTMEVTAMRLILRFLFWRHRGQDWKCRLWSIYASELTPQQQRWFGFDY